MTRLISRAAAWGAVVAFAVIAFPGAAAAESLLQRGQYLMRGIVACGNCHTPKDAQGRDVAARELAGGPPIGEPGVFTAYPPNLTPDPETGIGAWSDDELVTAIREGRRRDGTIIGPPMPFAMYRGLSDRDVRAIVAYLRSLPAVRNATPKSDYKIPLPPAWGPPVGSVPEPDPADIVAYGAYLAGPAGHCLECHTPFVDGRPDFANQLGAGGFEFRGPWGVSISANITPDGEHGIARYSDAELKQIITTGLRPDGSRLLPPMPVHYYANIKDADLTAIVEFLGTLEPRPMAD